jgi:hypothetical protein
LPEEDEGRLEVGDDRWGPPVCEREGKVAGLGWAGFRCWLISFPGWPRLGCYSFFILFLFLFSDFFFHFSLLWFLCFLKFKNILKTKLLKW